MERGLPNNGNGQAKGKLESNWGVLGARETSLRDQCVILVMCVEGVG